jgi:hypothetical protein
MGRTPIGPRSSPSTSCSSAPRPTRWSRSTAQSLWQWSAARRPGSTCCAHWTTTSAPPSTTAYTPFAHTCSKWRVTARQRDTATRPQRVARRVSPSSAISRPEPTGSLTSSKANLDLGRSRYQVASLPSYKAPLKRVRLVGVSAPLKPYAQTCARLSGELQPDADRVARTSRVRSQVRPPTRRLLAGLMTAVPYSQIGEGPRIGPSPSSLLRGYCSASRVGVYD